MQFKKTACAAAGVIAMLALAACGGNSDPSNTPPAAASAPSGASAPNAASTPASDAVAETSNYTVFNNAVTGVTPTTATLTFPAGSTVGTLATATAPNYATLTADTANDGVMTISGTPNFGVTAGTILDTTPVLLPGVIETCEAIAGQGTPNPGISGAATKSTNVMIAGPANTNITSIVGHTFNTYYEDCQRDGGTAATAGTHSSLSINPTTFAVVTFDAVTNTTTTVPYPSTLAVVSSAGLAGRYLLPYYYIVNGQYHLALIEHNDTGRIGIWLE
jgi:hypothetical protein